MKRLILIAIFSSFMIGCALDRSFVKSVDDYAKTILPEYKEYIQEDPNLEKDTKRIRIQTADKFQQLINDAIKESD